MTSFHMVRRVQYSPQQMFELVARIEEYPNFVPLCDAVTVTAREYRGQREIVTAILKMRYKKMIEETFTSRITLDPTKLRFLAEYLDGPLQYFQNRWKFLDAPGGCDVDFYVSYRFKSVMLQFVAGTVFDRALRRYTEAFEDRANMVYRTSRPRQKS